MSPSNPALQRLGDQWGISGRKTCQVCWHREANTQTTRRHGTNTHADFGVDVPVVQLLVQDQKNCIWKI